MRRRTVDSHVLVLAYSPPTLDFPRIRGSSPLRPTRTVRVSVRRIVVVTLGYRMRGTVRPAFPVRARRPLSPSLHRRRSAGLPSGRRRPSALLSPFPLSRFRSPSRPLLSFVSPKTEGIGDSPVRNVPSRPRRTVVLTVGLYDSVGDHE